MTEEERTPATRARAETALVRLCHELGDDTARLIVLGGLVRRRSRGIPTQSPPSTSAPPTWTSTLHELEQRATALGMDLIAVAANALPAGAGRPVRGRSLSWTTMLGISTTSLPISRSPSPRLRTAVSLRDAPKALSRATLVLCEQ